jgi:hypothetical protein
MISSSNEESNCIAAEDEGSIEHAGRDNQSQVQAEEDEPLMLTDTSATSLPTEGAESLGRVEAEASADAKLPFRSSLATRQTIEDLESQEKKQGFGCSSSCRCSETKPGAVAVVGEGNLVVTASTMTGRRPDPSAGDHAHSHGVMNMQECDTDCQPHPRGAFADDIPMIHAQLAEEPPFAVQAELVLPPPLALHVQFDEEAPPDPGALSMGGQRAPPTPAIRPLVDYPVDMKGKLLSKRNLTWFCRCQVVLLVLGLILALLIPKLNEEEIPMLKEGEKLEEDLQILLEDDYHHPFPEASPIMAAAEAPTPNYWEFAPTPTAAPTPQPSVISVLPCYKTTLEIAMAQLQNSSQDLYVLCPNVLHKIGSYNEDNTAIVDGEYPLMALLDNIEIRCWLDGGRDNKCVLDGGFLQVALNPTNFRDETLGLAIAGTGTLDNVVFRGITFTGELNTTADTSLVSGTSVYLNHPGLNVTFIDCAWENLVAPRGVAQIGDGNEELVHGNSLLTMGVTFLNCTFSNIEYGGEGTPLISVFGQKATIEHCRFRDLILSDPLVACELRGETMEWCQGILYCMNHSRCELNDICIDGLEYAGLAAIAATSHDADFRVSGSIIVEDLTSPGDLSFLNCSSGLARFGNGEYHIPECLDHDVSFSRATSDFCML